MASCNRKVFPTAKVNYLKEVEGTITMRAIGTGKGMKQAIADAEKNAIQVILFRGLPESQQNLPMIPLNEYQAVQKYPEYFRLLYDKYRYRTFIMASVPTLGSIKSTKKLKSIAVDLKINIYALRRDLEQNGIINKFGLN